MTVYPLEAESLNPVHAMIKRFDHKFYNFVTKKFEARSGLKLSLVRSSTFPTVWIANPIISITPEFLPGRYTTYYCQGESLHKSENVEILKTDICECLTLDLIAGRIATVRTYDGSLVKTLNKLSEGIDELLRRGMHS